MDHIIISEGTRADLRMCFEQALEYLEKGEYDGGWVVFKTIDVTCLLELVEAIGLGCNELVVKG